MQAQYGVSLNLVNSCRDLRQQSIAPILFTYNENFKASRQIVVDMKFGIFSRKFFLNIIPPPLQPR
jgi:hypothetical protein